MCIMKPPTTNHQPPTTNLFSLKNYRQIYEYIKSDYVRYGGKPKLLKILINVLFGRNHCFVFSFWLRLCSTKNIFYILARIMHKKYVRKYGLQIYPRTQIGYGLYIGHGIGIVISSSAKIGDNCNLSQFTTIGSNHNKAAVIGDNVYIGPSVCIVEDVIIGNNVTIGAGSVVVKDVPENATVAGVPAKILNYNNAGRYVNNRWKK
ncbi:serine acetyltransferase [Spirochaetia bacterium]|nr:serine acetyltransferase [Spirochaetia bacterium]